VMRWCWEEAMEGRPTLEKVAGLLESIALQGDQGASADTEPHDASATLKPSHRDDSMVNSVQSRSKHQLSGSWLRSLRVLRPERDSGLERPLLPLTAVQAVGSVNAP